MARCRPDQRRRQRWPRLHRRLPARSLFGRRRPRSRKRASRPTVAPASRYCSANQLPDFTQCVGNRLYERASDPVGELRPQRRRPPDIAVLQQHRQPGQRGSGQQVARRQRRSASGARPITLKRDTNPAVFNDKESITADQNNANYVYARHRDRLVFPNERTHGKSYLNTAAFRGPTWFSRTTNGGSSWESRPTDL